MTNGSLASAASDKTDPSSLPGGSKALSEISIRAFLLGVVLGISIIVTVLCTLQSIPLWRASFFLSSLCLFHFLEYYTTAAYNTRYADVSAFLLSSNGIAYNVAHGSAMAECLLSHWLAPNGYLPDHWTIPPSPIITGIGMVLMLIGQTVRTLAMAQAGSNFNHTVQVEYKEGHTLVTRGIYSMLRHPSYFGFFWWGLGTQLVLQNVVGFVGYALVLWRFFNVRIQRKSQWVTHHELNSDLV
jgi:protein-S-isoprenylcysteine O-methyltransferase